MQHRGVHRHSARLALGLVTFLVMVLVSPPVLAEDAPAPDTPTATGFPAMARVGPIFTGPITGKHGCTASVIASPSHDLVLTAAHCITGTAQGWLFAPGYHNGVMPYGVWTVTAAYVNSEWATHLDPAHDYALVRVAPQRVEGRLTDIETITGGNTLGLAPADGVHVTTVAYNAGVGGTAIGCEASVYYMRQYPGFDCHGYVGGSSGSPWLLTFLGIPLPIVVGLIGGLYHGGCHEYTSYSSAFREGVYRLLNRALQDHNGDTVPSAGDDGC